MLLAIGERIKTMNMELVFADIRQAIEQDFYFHSLHFTATALPFVPLLPANV